MKCLLEGLLIIENYQLLYLDKIAKNGRKKQLFSDKKTVFKGASIQQQSSLRQVWWF